MTPLPPNDRKTEPPAGSGGPTSPEEPTYRVEDLFAGWRELRLWFGDEEYRLRITRNRKLILTK